MLTTGAHADAAVTYTEVGELYSRVDDFGSAQAEEPFIVHQLLPGLVTGATHTLIVKFLI